MRPSLTRAFTAVALPLLVILLALPRVARADEVDTLIAQLRGSRDYKVRLSAALSLTRIEDSRAIAPLLAALGDSNKTVRGVAAASLGKLVTSKTTPRLRKQVLIALRRVAKGDRDSFVRRRAKTSYRIIAKARAPSAAPSSGGIYVNVGPMAAKSDGSGKMAPLMRKVVVQTIAKRASSIRTEWPSGTPSGAQLAASGATAFHVDGTLIELSEATAGSSTIVSCKVSMLIATYPEKSMFGFLNGGGKVEAGTNAKDVQYAREDCVTAVVEDLIAKKVIPTLQTRSQ